MSDLTRTLKYPAKPIRAAVLLEELAEIPGAEPRPDELENVQAGVRLELGGDEIRIAVREEVDPNAVAAAVAAHDAAALDKAAADELAQHEAELDVETTLRTRAADAIATLEQAHAGWGALTAAQKDAALKLTVRVTISLARLALRRLDSA